MEMRSLLRKPPIPIVWRTLNHNSSSVSYEAYRSLLDAVSALLPSAVKVVFLADRGFADINVMSHVRQLGWHFRIRIKSNFWVYRRGHARCKVGRFCLWPGEALFLQQVHITTNKYGPVHLASTGTSFNQW